MSWILASLIFAAMNRIIIAITVLTLAAGGGYAIKAHKEAILDERRREANAECVAMLSGLETQMDLREASPKAIEACILRGSFTSEDLLTRIDEITHPPALKDWDWKKN